MAFNTHRVFTGTTGKDYLAELTLAKEEEDELRAARDTLRTALKAGFSERGQWITDAALFETAAIKMASPPALKPKFKMQGSFSYRTLNVPAQMPPQEMDLDDGMFLPVSFLNDTSDSNPIIASSGYFKLVEKILAPVCKAEGWTLVKDKPSCVRVELSSKAHVDFALYAIPDGDYERLVEKAMKSETALQRMEIRDAISMADMVYREIPLDHIMLAHRDDGWIKSDPRKLEAWFQDAVKLHGEQLRRLCRYLKGWRDHQWSSCRLASIALMAVAIAIYEEAKASLPPENRDDEALLLTTERLPVKLAGRIKNPVVDDAYLDEGWTEDMRAEFIEKAEDLHQTLKVAAQGSSSPREALRHLTSAFGDRIPDDVSLIQTDDGTRTAHGVAATSVLTSGLLKEIAAEPQDREAVQKEGDGRFG